MFKPCCEISRISAASKPRVAKCLVIAAIASGALAFPCRERATAQQCPGDFPLQNYTGGGQVACPCFIPDEQAGVVLTAPLDHYPIEVLRILVGWGSQFGGAPQTLEQALHLYAGGLPDPGAPIFSLLGPQLSDGFINQFDIELMPGNKTIASGPFTVSLQFLNQNAGDIFAPSVVHDGNGCQAGKNVVYAIPGGWLDACPLGVTGDWVFSVVYRCSAPTGTEEHVLTASTGLADAQPNPLRTHSQIRFSLSEPSHALLQVLDVRGRVVTTLANRSYGQGQHLLTWGGEDPSGARVPAGIYFVRLRVGADIFSRKVVVRD